MAGVEVIGEAVTKLTAPLDGLKGDLARAKSLVATSSDDVAGKAKGAGLAIGAAVGAGALGAATGLFKLGETFDEQFDKIRVGTGATGSQLKGLEGDFKETLKNVPEDFDSVGDAVTGLNQKLGLSGPGLQSLAEQFLNLSHVTGTDVKSNIDAVTGAYINWGITADDQPERLDQLYRASQATGVSVADLASQMSSSGAVLRSQGFTFEQSAALLGSLGKAGLSAGDVMPALSRALANAAKSGKPAGEALQSIFTKIQNAPSQTQAAAIAVENFGTKGGKMADLIRSGALSVGDLTNQIANGKDTINGAAADTEDFSEKWQKLKNKALVALEPVATKVFGIVTKFMGWLGDHTGVLEVFAGIVGTLLVAAFGAWAVSLFTTGGALAFLLSPIVAIVAGIALLAAGVLYAYNHFKIFHDGVQLAWDIIQGVFHWVQSNWPLLLAILTGPIGLAVLLIKSHFDAIKQGFSDVVQWISTGIDAVVGFFTALPGRVMGFLSTVWNGITSGISAAATWVGDRISDVVGFVTGIAGRIAGAVSTMWDGLKSGITAAKNWVHDRIEDVIGIVSGLKDRVASIGRTLWDGLKSGLTGVGNDIIRGFERIINLLIRGVNGIIHTYNRIPLAPNIGDVPEVHLPRLATGGQVGIPGWAIVGEEGPEMVRMPRGAEVFSNAISQRMAAASASAGDGYPLVPREIVLQVDRQVLGRVQLDWDTDYARHNPGRGRKAA